MEFENTVHVLMIFEVNQFIEKYSKMIIKIQFLPIGKCVMTNIEDFFHITLMIQNTSKLMLCEAFNEEQRDWDMLTGQRILIVWQGHRGLDFTYHFHL